MRGESFRTAEIKTTQDTIKTKLNQSIISPILTKKRKQNQIWNIKQNIARKSTLKIFPCGCALQPHEKRNEKTFQNLAVYPTNTFVLQQTITRWIILFVHWMYGMQFCLCLSLSNLPAGMAGSAEVVLKHLDPDKPTPIYRRQPLLQSSFEHKKSKSKAKNEDVQNKMYH